jgi:ABC-2 type transport system permease protein
MVDYGLDRIFRLKIAFQTMKDHWKVTIILTLLFMGMTTLYSGMYPAFNEYLTEMIQSGAGESFSMIRGAEAMDTYAGFLNIELYQIFWILILGIILGFLSASTIAKEIESKTIDLLMSNPVSKKQIIFEKYLGFIPMILIINLGTFLTVIGITTAINEELNFANAALTHLSSIPYFLAVIGIGLIVSVIINEKMKASIVMIAIIVGMFIFESLGNMIPDYESMGLISLTHYYDPSETLINGEVNITGLIVLSVIAVWAVITAMIYFEHKDITI